MPKGFISLGRGMTINSSLVKELKTFNNRYYIYGVYGESYQIDKRHYERAMKVLNLE